MTAGLKGFAASRHASILLCAVALLPLCMLTSLSALAPSSIIGVLGVFVTGGFIGLRVKQGAYAAGGALAAAVAPELRPVFGATGMRPLFPSSLVLISMVATAYQAHFSAPAFYNALEGKSIAKFNQVTAISFGIIAAVTVAMTAWGFLTFGGACSGLVLNNYATMDAGATLSRLLMGFAIFGAYPLCFAAAREALFELYPRLIPARTAFTRLMHAILTVGGLLIADVGFVVSFIGAVLGSAIIYIFPALLFLATSRAREANGAAPTSLVKAERWGCRGMAALGIALDDAPPPDHDGPTLARRRRRHQIGIRQVGCYNIYAQAMMADAQESMMALRSCARVVGMGRCLRRHDRDEMCFWCGRAGHRAGRRL